MIIIVNRTDGTSKIRDLMTFTTPCIPCVPKCRASLMDAIELSC